MPLTFAEAKKIYNPDPNFFPKAFSPEHLDILRIMTQSGTVTIGDRIASQIVTPAPVTELKATKLSEYVNPLNRQIIDEPDKKPVSKHDWLSIKSNRDAFNKIINKNN